MLSSPAILLSAATLLLVALSWMFVRWWRTRLTLLQYLLWQLNYFVAHTYWGGRVEGRLQIDDDQGAILICNHHSPVDPAFPYLTTDRVVHWMVAREFIQHPVLAWMARTIGIIPVGRAGVDTAATRTAIRILGRGGLVGIFPEGRLNESEQLLLPGRPGAALIALTARVPVVPCYIRDSPQGGGSVYGSFFRRARARLVIGDPIDLSPYYGREKEKQVQQELTLLFLREIASLAGHRDFEPRLAGRRWMTESIDDLGDDVGDSNGESGDREDRPSRETNDAA